MKSSKHRGLHRVLYRKAEVTDPEQSVQLYNLQWDGVGEQVLCLENIKNTHTNVKFDAAKVTCVE